jgi:hypothetical protein
MSRILGLDLGTNSIGWANIDTNSDKVIDFGVKVFPNSLNNERQISRQHRRKENRLNQRTLSSKRFDFLLTRTNPIIAILFLGSFLTAMLTIINFSNWQFWFNSFLTILLATLTLLHSDNKK